MEGPESFVRTTEGGAMTEQNVRPDTPALTESDLGPLGIWPSKTRDDVPETRELWAAASAAPEETYVPPRSAPLSYFRVKSVDETHELEVERRYLSAAPESYDQTLSIRLYHASKEIGAFVGTTSDTHRITYDKHEGFGLEHATMSLRVELVEEAEDGKRYAGPDRPCTFVFKDASEEVQTYTVQVYLRDFVAMACAVRLFYCSKSTHWAREPESISETQMDISSPTAAIVDSCMRMLAVDEPPPMLLPSEQAMEYATVADGGVAESKEEPMELELPDHMGADAAA